MEAVSQHTPPSPEDYLDDLFGSAHAEHGGIVQLSAFEMERFAGRSTFISFVNERGYHALENRGRIVVFCNSSYLKLLA